MTARTPEAWAQAVRDGLAGLTGASTLSGTVQVDVTGGTAGDVSVHAVLDAGRLAAAGPGPADGADATMTLSEEDARAVVAGHLDPSVAFMQGRMKVAGDMGVVLDLLALVSSPPAAAARSRIAAAPD